MIGFIAGAQCNQVTLVPETPPVARKLKAATGPVTLHPGLASHAPIRNPALATAVQSATPQAVSTSTTFSG